MSRTLKKVNVRFDEKNLLLDETFPPDLAGLIEEPDYEAVIRKINVELNIDLVDTRAEMRKWARLWACTAPALVGLVLTPVLARKARHYREALAVFWEDVKAHLAIINRRANAKRQLKWVEWHIKQSGHNKRGTDVFDPYTVFQVLVVVKQRPQRSQGYVPKQLHKQKDITAADADTSLTGYEQDATIPATFLAGTDRRVSFVTPFSDSTEEPTTTTEPSTAFDASIAGASIATASIAAAASIAGARKTGDNDDETAASKTGDKVHAHDSIVPVVVAAGDRPQSGSSIEAVSVGDRPASSSSSINPLSEQRPLSSASSIDPISEQQQQQDTRQSVISLAPVEMEPDVPRAALPVLMEEREDSDFTIDDPTAEDGVDDSDSTISPLVEPKADDISDDSLPALQPLDVASDGSIEAVEPAPATGPIMSSESEFEAAEDLPDGHALRPLLSDSDSGSII